MGQWYYTMLYFPKTILSTYRNLYRPNTRWGIYTNFLFKGLFWFLQGLDLPSHTSKMGRQVVMLFSKCLLFPTSSSSYFFLVILFFLLFHKKNSFILFILRFQDSAYQRKSCVTGDCNHIVNTAWSCSVMMIVDSYFKC